MLRDLPRAVAVTLTVLVLGAAAAGGTSSISVAGRLAPEAHLAPATQSSSTAPAVAAHAHGVPPAAFQQRAQGVTRSSGRPPLDARDAADTATPPGTDPSGSDASGSRADRLARARADVAQERTRAAIAARASTLARQAATTTQAAEARRVALENRHVLPLPDAKIVATFGETGVWARYHTGIDFAAPLGTPIHAAAAGVVTHAGPGGGAGGWAGSHVTIEHAGGYQTLYAHMNPAIAVFVGEHVRAGQVIGHVGLTGRTFGPHCHFELYPSGAKPGDVYSAIDPMPWLRSSGTAS